MTPLFSSQTDSRAVLAVADPACIEEVEKRDDRDTFTRALAATERDPSQVPLLEQAADLTRATFERLCSGLDADGELATEQLTGPRLKRERRVIERCGLHRRSIKVIAPSEGHTGAKSKKFCRFSKSGKTLV